MVKRTGKYSWRYRDEYFNIKNRQDQVIQEIERLGYSSSRIIQFVDGFYAMTGFTSTMTGVNNSSSNPLSKSGVQDG